MEDTNTLPVFVVRDPDVIAAETKARMEEILQRELQPGQVEQLILNAFNYREVLLNNRFNAGMAQMLFQFSSAPVLDYLAALVAVERLPAASASCTVRFTLIAGHGSVLIPEGTRVATSDSAAIFSTTKDITATADILTVDVMVEAMQPGTEANGYTAGEVNAILDPLPYVSTVANLDVTAGGSDPETGEQLLARLKLAPSQFSSAGSDNSYVFYAYIASPLIIDVQVPSPVPGTVLIIPLTIMDETPPQILQDVYTACNPENVRPLTDTVIVSAPTPIDYAIEVDVVLFEDTPAAELQASILTELQNYAKSKRALLGQDIMRSHIIEKSRKERVYDVDVVSPAENIVVEDTEFARCTGIKVNITGFSRG